MDNMHTRTPKIKNIQYIYVTYSSIDCKFFVVVVVKIKIPINTIFRNGFFFVFFKVLLILITIASVIEKNKIETKHSKMWVYVLLILCYSNKYIYVCV